MADLDNITCNLKSRLHGSHTERAPSPREPLNHTGHSTQTETETSALTNSQQFLPLPAEVPTSGTDGEPRTMEGTKGSALSTAYGSLRSTDLYEPPSGTSTMLSGAVREAVGGLLHHGEEELHHSGNSGGHDSILARGPALLEEGDRPFRSYHPLSHHSSDEEDEGWKGLGHGEDHVDQAEGFVQDYDDYNTDDDVGGEVVVPRALNDISNANFNNMMSAQDYTSRLIEEDSWFTATSPRRGSHLQCTIETVTDEANPPATTDPEQSLRYTGPLTTDQSLHYTGPLTTDQSLHHNYTGPLTDTAGTLGGTVTTLGGTVTTLGGTVTSLGGTATSLGSVAQDG